MTALKQLQEMDYNRKKQRYPNVKPWCLPVSRFSDKSANQLTACILRWLELNGHKSWRQSSEGRYRQGHQYTDVIGRVRVMKGTYIPGTNAGHADISSIIGGIFCCWEIKMKDKQSDKQKKFQKEVEASGGRYFICHSFDEFMTQYNVLVIL